MEQTLWSHLPLLVRSASKDSVEDILQALWRTRKTGLDDTDRETIRNMLQLPDESDLDPLLVCLRILMRRCVYEDVSKEEIHKLFPEEVLPELRRLLTLLLLKFQKNWQEEVMMKDQVTVPQSNTVARSMAEQEVEPSQPVAGVNLKHQTNTQPQVGE
uniref:Uncharacterized protein n=1 Tax=Kalanchoe fedtschenkoi TaxID=63787 RepID=A0A7N0UWB5_KALFE